MSERPLSELAAEIAAGAVRLTAATAGWLRLVAEFDEREGWAGYGIRSCAEWLAWQCGLSPGPAREHVRVARALRGLPVLAAAFAAGRLSYSKVRALTRVAEAGTQAALLEFAREATASQVERTVRAWRRADAPDSGSQAARRRIDWWWDADGMLVLRPASARSRARRWSPPSTRLAERDARRDRAAGTKAARRAGVTAGSERPGCEEDEAVAVSRERTTARRLAALASLAETAAASGRRPGDPPRRQVVVHLDAAVLADDTAAGRAFLDGGPALSPAQARRLACEGTVVAMVERGRESSPSAAPAGWPPAPSAWRCCAATAAAPAPAAPKPASNGCTPTTCGTGCTAGAPTCPIWCCSATPATAWPTTSTWS